MAQQLTVRSVPDDVGKRLDRISRARGKSLNAVVLDTLTESVGVDARRATRSLRHVDAGGGFVLRRHPGKSEGRAMADDYPSDEEAKT